jgi:hypothetical protein
MDTQKPALRLPDTHEKAQLLFPIIGIGASAGGFAALATLLQNLPASPGMALVIILHLPADQQSNADRVLQRSTRLPVVQVNHSTPILPDQVYIIPPARSLRMEGGHLVLHELERSVSDPEVIDVFFRTLAMAHREKAIGVILSGMGADGTAGLTCIKEQGGVTLVQTPAEAEHPSMPQSAIDTGMADFVLAAAQMPAKLIELRDITSCKRYASMPCMAMPPPRFASTWALIRNRRWRMCFRCCTNIPATTFVTTGAPPCCASWSGACKCAASQICQATTPCSGKTPPNRKPSSRTC